MEFLKNLQWYHYAIVALILVISFLIIMDWGCSKSTCQNAVRSNETFNSQSNQQQAQNELVLYHAAFCGYCKQFMPAWDQFAESAKTTFPNLKVTKRQCDGADKAICDKNDIPGFPTVKLYLSNGNDVTFEGDRSVQGLTDFCNSNISA